MTSSNGKTVGDDLFSLQPSFIIGTAASAHQVEGHNRNDWTLFEQQGGVVNNQQSGRATDHYNLYETDFKLLSDLGFKTHRLSIEWSRIMPEEDVINTDEIQHYKEVLLSMKENDLISFVTLHHFTSPVWFIERGGFKKRRNLDYWESYVELVCKELGPYVDVFNTINEPFVYATTGYMQGIHSPGEKSLFSYFRVCNNLMRAHYIAVEIVRSICPNTPIGIVKNIAEFQSKSKNPVNLIINWFSDWGFNRVAMKSLKTRRLPFGLRKIKRGDKGDFVGINFYMKMVTGIGLPDLMLPHNIGETKLTQMGWGVHPESLVKELTRFTKQVNLPIFITENGIATDDDMWRIEYIEAHLSAIIELLTSGIDIRGYFYWSNIDNFEWEQGYIPKFGLMAFDPETFEREPKNSARYLGEMAKKSKYPTTMIQF